MSGCVVVGVVAAVRLLPGLSVKVVKQYEQGVLLAEPGVDKNTAVVFPAPPMSTIGELGTFLAPEASAVSAIPTQPESSRG